MGFAITWCGFRDGHIDPLLDELGLMPTGEMEEVPESSITLAKLSTGWNVLWYNRPTEKSCSFLSKEKMAELSTTRDLLLCSVDEHVMFSSAELWVKGEQHWMISHDSSDDPSEVKSYGEPPVCYEGLKREMELQQIAADQADEGVDYIFEIPLLVAKELIGFKHDECDSVFVRLQAKEPTQISRFPFNQFPKWFSSR